MLEEDKKLLLCNETELLQIARKQGLGVLKRGLPRDLLVSIVAGDVSISPEHVASTSYTRQKLEEYIARHWGKVCSQLPGCNGKCTSFPCSEGRHALCFAPNAEAVQ